MRSVYQNTESYGTPRTIAYQRTESQIPLFDIRKGVLERQKGGSRNPIKIRNRTERPYQNTESYGTFRIFRNDVHLVDIYYERRGRPRLPVQMRDRTEHPNRNMESYGTVRIFTNDLQMAANMSPSYTLEIGCAQINT